MENIMQEIEQEAEEKRRGVFKADMASMLERVKSYRDSAKVNTKRANAIEQKVKGLTDTWPNVHYSSNSAMWVVDE